MKNQICFTVVFFTCLCFVKGQSDTKIDWKNWPELEQLIAKQPKPIYIFFHAEWCAYCTKMERKVFTKPEVIKKLNSEYYAVEMNVERTDTIIFDGVKFRNKQALNKRNGIHEIPLLLASRKDTPFSLPATIILNKDFTVKQRVFEYYTSKKLLELLE